MPNLNKSDQIEKEANRLVLSDEGATQSVTSCNQLKMAASDGKNYKTDCADTETMFRTIESVPPRMRRAVFNVAEGDVRIEFPEGMSKDSVEDLQGYVNIWFNKLRRDAGTSN